MGNNPEKKRKEKDDRENNKEDNHDKPLFNTKNTAQKKVSPKRKPKSNKDKSGQTHVSSKKEKKEPGKKRKKEKIDPKSDVKTEVKTDAKGDGKSEPFAKKAKETNKAAKRTKLEDNLQKGDKKPHTKGKAPDGKSKDKTEKSERTTPKSKQAKKVAVTTKKTKTGSPKPAGKAVVAKTKDSGRPIISVKDNKNSEDTVVSNEKSVISSQTIQSKQEDCFHLPKTNNQNKASIKKNIEKLKKSDKLKETSSKKKQEAKAVVKSNKEKEQKCQTINKSPIDQKSNQPFMIAEVSRPPLPKGSSVKSKGTEVTVADDGGLSSKNDPATGSLDSKIEFDMLGKSTVVPKSDSTITQDEDQAYADERLNPIFKEEFEHLYEKLKTLNRAVITLKESYRDHIRSMVKMSKQEPVISSSESVDGKMSLPITNMLTNISDLKTTVGGGGGIFEGKERKSKKDTDINTRYRLEANKSDVSQVVIVDSRFDMTHFLDPVMRDKTFGDLFKEVAALNDELTRLKDFYDNDGDFMIQEYENSEYRISRNTFDSVRQKSQMLLTIVQKVTRIYNQDLLDMFRIK